MLHTCANPSCCKPLHYLREGRIFIFDRVTPDNNQGEKDSRHREHYWLCGKCSRTLILTQDKEGNIRAIPRLPSSMGDEESFLTGAYL